ncbi:hypothetical protein [Caballeronia sp. dw_19]|uniref:hypothetical protein n=1 Tax=Caballeronia sp. dw_19 TaxID=2719791 RepID=UPI001BD3230A|nr:hypothetical protein [Caballeronia sp. dw_19]
MRGAISGGDNGALLAIQPSSITRQASVTKADLSEAMDLSGSDDLFRPLRLPAAHGSIVL